MSLPQLNLHRDVSYHEVYQLLSKVRLIACRTQVLNRAFPTYPHYSLAFIDFSACLKLTDKKTMYIITFSMLSTWSTWKGVCSKNGSLYGPASQKFFCNDWNLLQSFSESHLRPLQTALELIFTKAFFTDSGHKFLAHHHEDPCYSSQNITQRNSTKIVFPSTIMRNEWKILFKWSAALQTDCVFRA